MGEGPPSFAALVVRLVDDQRVAALDLDVVGVALAAAGDRPSRIFGSSRSRPCEQLGIVDVGERAPSRRRASEARLRKREHGVGGEPARAASSATTRRSARRITVRATSSWAESGGAAGDHELRRQLDPVHVAVDHRLELGRPSPR